MKIILLCFWICLSTLTGRAATINYSTTTTGNRVVLSADSFAPISEGIVILGTLSDENDFRTFEEFGRSTINSNAAFSSGVISGSTTNNMETVYTFAEKAMYFVIYNAMDPSKATEAGVYRSTSLFDAAISSSASQSLTVEVSSFTTAINPNLGWIYGASAVYLDSYTGSAGNPPTNRTGIVFALTIPEPSHAILGIVTGVVCGITRRRQT